MTKEMTRDLEMKLLKDKSALNYALAAPSTLKKFNSRDLVKLDFRKQDFLAV